MICTPASHSLPSGDQRCLRKFQIRTGKWKPTGIGPYVVTTLYGTAEPGFPAAAQPAAQMGNPNQIYGATGTEQEICCCLAELFCYEDTLIRERGRAA